jgi:hypothetical protein
MSRFPLPASRFPLIFGASGFSRRCTRDASPGANSNVRWREAGSRKQEAGSGKQEAN